MKINLQGERSEKMNQAEEPYPDTARLTTEGIILDQKPQPFSLARVMGNRRVRHRMYEVFKDMMAADPRLSGCRITFDYSEEGPVFIDLGKPPVVRKDLQNNLGEADLGVVWWARRYRKHHVLVHSTDLDTLLILMLHGYGFRRSLYMQLPSSQARGGHCCVDITGLNSSLMYMGVSPVVVVMGMMMAGTDFVKKKELCPGGNDRKVLDFVVNTWFQEGDKMFWESEVYAGMLTEARSSSSRTAGRLPVYAGDHLRSVLEGSLIVANLDYWLSLQGVYPTRRLPVLEGIDTVEEWIKNIPSNAERMLKNKQAKRCTPSRWKALLNGY
jgi:hypothetical protein